MHIKPYINFINDQHHFDDWRSPESWSSLLTSLLAENNGGTCAIGQLVKKHNKHSFQNSRNSLFSVVLSCTDTMTRYLNLDIKPKSGSFNCFMKQTNGRFRVICPCFASCFSVGT